MKRSKEVLDDILCQLYDLEYEQEALEYILARVEQSYGDFDNKETKLVLTMTKVYVVVVKNRLQSVADQLDEILSKHTVIN